MMPMTEENRFHNEIKRQLLHFAFGVIWIVVYLFLGRINTLALLLATIIIGYAIVLQIQRGSFKIFHALVKHVERENESHFPGLPAFLLLFGFLLTIGIFPNPDAVLAGLLVLTFGDSIATIIGKYYGKINLVSNRTLEGTIAGIILATIPLYFFFPWKAAILIATIGMLAEYLPLDDNLGIPIVTAIAATLLL